MESSSTHRHTETETSRHTETETSRHTETETQITKSKYSTSTNKSQNVKTKTESLPTNLYTALNLDLIKDDPALTFYNYTSTTIEKELNNKKCKNKQDCFNVGECSSKTNTCEFKDIYCTNSNCFIDNHCNLSFVNKALSRYLKECEKEPIVVFESCRDSGKKNSNCYTRICYSSKQCLSGNCFSGRCMVNDNKPIFYCSNTDSDTFKCKRFRYEVCENDDDCYSNRCGNIDNVESKVEFRKA